MTKLVFMHGLNTFKDDDLHLGPLRFGPMDSQLNRALMARGRSLFSPVGIGAGSPVEQATLVCSQLLALKDETFYLLGHSIGGLVARALAHRPELKGRIKGVITFGTPHHGANVAELGLTFADRHPHLNRALSASGYKTTARKDIYAQFTCERIEDFNRLHPQPSDIPHFSLICEARANQLGWPLRLSYRYLHPRSPGENRPASDGFIWSSAQHYGKSLGPFALDHFAETGFFFQLSQVRRIEAEKEFNRMVDVILDLTASQEGA